MPSAQDSDVELKSAVAVNEEAGTLQQTVGPADGFEIKSEADGTSYVEGYIATKEAYATPGQPFDQEFMTEDALRDIANQINEANNNLSTGDVTFPDPADVETVTGNLEHQNSPAAEKLKTIRDLADTRTVPAISMTEAEYDGYGVKVKTPIREKALPNDTVEAIKNNIKEGILSAYSIEFKLVKDKISRAKDGVKRMIDKVNVTGVGLTSAPRNPTARLTNAEIRSVLSDSETIFGEELIDEIKSEVREEVKEELRSENDINGDSTVPEENEEEAQANSEAGEEETKSLADEVEELKSVISDVKETNEEIKSEKEALEQENEELKSQLEDYQEIEEMKSEIFDEIDGLKDELKSATPEEEPVADENEERMEETKSANEQRLENELKARKNPMQFAEENKSVLADKYGVDEEEVTKYAN